MCKTNTEKNIWSHAVKKEANLHRLQITVIATSRLTCCLLSLLHSVEEDQIKSNGVDHAVPSDDADAALSSGSINSSADAEC